MLKGDGLRSGKKGRVKFEEKWVGLRVGEIRVGKKGRDKGGEKGIGLRVQ